ncbi:ferric reductase-like transmembrane domain-containing protein [Paracoccus sp. MBLB3053]|uniref:Ferric reductase-like transmembrane domain-containing protein n=1 Tax=Paracoccus aurantius TaxID=3073814 RepID=A0ABU2HX82_9RHOB|nr:ferric reductase-like transmembrane domain-containing protein [Paracoccus sp. MBLB3053]MDS9469160.1 ferric reductase-like transmembrane domain-containing protein [Paracoccus sp. MBLB3053]
MSRRSYWYFWGSWAVFAAVWFATNLSALRTENFFALRAAMMQLSGVWATGAMSLAMLLALRPRWPEARLGGLDKMYRFHKWLGLGFLVVSILHWLWAKGPKWAAGLGLLTRPERPAGGRPAITDPIRAYLGGLRGTAEGLGEWAFYALALLLVIALVKMINYRLFRYTHRLVPLAYLVLAFHSLVLFDYAQWRTPIGILLALLLAGGSWAALASIFGLIGKGRRVAGEISSLKHYPGVRSLESVIKLGEGWQGHKAGQFAFVTSNPLEGAHPYTIASAWLPATREVTFISKELGDHTTGLADKLRIGQKVTVEGPYGCFTFDDGRDHQIWIGAGIGITPFVARMKELAASEHGADLPQVDLFHTTNEVDEAALARLAADARAANVRLHLLIDARDGRLNGARIRETVPDWREAGLWFCGPSGFGSALRADFAAQGMAVDERFHQELFEMR